MSKRRKPGEIVSRRPGSGFCGAADPHQVRIPEGKAYEMDCIRGPDGEWQVNPGGEASYCMMECGDPECREWANVMVVGGPYAGEFMHHITECEMDDDRDHT